ncbi:MAG: pilus assembly protein PilM [Candidatus Dojkabacteria bacterium]|nr:pilus assembly protein PilM [Candidatus Dojkabacteria bacterium]
MDKNSENQKGAILGIDISDASIEGCVILKEGQTYKLVSKGKVNLDNGVVERGLLKRPKQFQVALQKLIKVAKFATKEVVISLPENAMYMISEDIPLDRKVDISGVVKSRLEGVIPDSIESMAIMHEMIPEVDKGRLVIRATNKNNLLAIKKEMEMAGFKVVAIESESEAKARSIVKDTEKDKNILILDIGAMSTAVSIFDSRGISLSTTIPYAGRAISENIAEKLKKPLGEVDKLKHELGLSASGGDVAVREAILEILGKIVKELDDSINFYKSSQGKGIDEIRILGGTGRMKGLREYLESEIKGVRIAFAKTWVDAGGEDVFSYFQTAIGLALKGLNYNNSLERGNLLNALSESNDSQGRKDGLLDRLKGIFHRDRLRESQFSEKRLSKQAKQDIPVQLTGTTKNAEGEKILKKVLSASTKPLKKRNQLNVKSLLILIPSIILIVGSLSLVVYELFFRGSEEGEVMNTGRSSFPVDYEVELGEVSIDTTDSKFVSFTETIIKNYSFKATGVAEPSEYIKGRIKIYNETGTGYNLVATTRVITKDGKLYRLDEAVLVPAGGDIISEVTADEAGAEYSLDKGVKMTFPGLASQDIDDQFYAEVFTGFESTSSGKYVTKEDLEKAKDEVDNSLETIDFSKVVFEMEDEAVISDEVYQSKVEGIEFNVKKGDKTDSFEAVVTILVTKIGILNNDLNALMDDALKASLQSSETVSDYYLTKCSLGVSESQEKTEVLDIAIKCIAIKND